MEILELLTELALKYPDMRFNQLLILSGITISGYDFHAGTTIHDVSFYEESQDTLLRMKEKIPGRTK
jgi:hypothetical protein